MLLAETLCAWRGVAPGRVRRTAVVASALANNLPDIDIVYTRITGPAPLGSLLHHRGHTHTLPVALVGSLFLGLGVWRWLRRREPGATPEHRALIYGLCLAGAVLHLLMDFGNNYGVHPFWPLSGRWFYGDSIFIVEPLWWAVAVPPLASFARQTWLRISLWSLLVAVVLVCWFLPFVPWTSRLCLLAVSLGSWWASRELDERRLLAVACAAWLSVASLFCGASWLAKARLARATEAAFPALTQLDLALTPMPANPACWEAFVAGEQHGQYRVVRASVALLPFTSTCVAGEDATPTADVEILERATRGGVRFRSQYSASVDELRQLSQNDCRFRALLLFARLPFVADGRAWRSAKLGKVAGDLRYDRSPDLDFSDVPLPSPVPTESGPSGCPRFVPGWRAPRADLFQR
jgi:inner membrane protein